MDYESISEFLDVDHVPINDEDQEYVVLDQPLRGYKRHPEIGKAISESRKGIVFTDEHCRNISIAKKAAGRVTSPEQAEQLRQSQLGRKHDYRSGRTKTWTIEDDTGFAFTVDNLFEWCKCEGIIHSSIRHTQRSNGYHKGFRILGKS